MNRTSQPASHISVYSNLDTELFLINGKLQLVANGVGEISTDALPGLYKIRAIRAGIRTEKIVELRSGKNVQERLYLDNLQTILPSTTMLGDDAKSFAKAVGRLNKRHQISLQDNPDRVRVYFFTWANRLQKKSLFSRVRVFPQNATSEARLLSRETVETLNANGRKWQITLLDLDPGPYMLELPIENRRQRLLLPVMKAREMHVGLCHLFEGGETARKKESHATIEVAIQARRHYTLSTMSAEQSSSDYNDFTGYLANSGELELEFSARHALDKGRRLALDPTYVMQLLNQKFDNPLTGLAAAHLMFDAIEVKAAREKTGRSLGTVEMVDFKPPLIKTVLRNLCRLLLDPFDPFDNDRVESMVNLQDSGQAMSGPYPQNPDLVAIFLRSGRRWDEPVPINRPPLFMRSWEVLQRVEFREAVTISPRLWSDTKLNRAIGPYLSWEPRRMSLKNFVEYYSWSEGVDSLQVAPATAGVALEAGFSSYLSFEPGILKSVVSPDRAEARQRARKLAAGQLNIPVNVAKSLL